MEATLATLGAMVLGALLTVAGTSPMLAPSTAIPTLGPQPDAAASLTRLLVAVPGSDPRFETSLLETLAARLRVADPVATPIVMLPDDPTRTLGPLRVTVEPPATQEGLAGGLRVDVDGAATFVARLRSVDSDPTHPPRVHVIEILGDATGIAAHRTGLLVLTPDELRLPTWGLPAAGADAVALDGAWWTLGPTPPVAQPSALAASHPLRTRLAGESPSAMRRLVDVSEGDVTGDGVPDIALSFRRQFRTTLLNASRPRRAWTDADGLSAHVGLYRTDDLSEIWVAGTLVRPVRRLAACTGALAVAYSTLRRSRIVATSAWRWQGFAFLPLPELPGRGTPTCIDIDHDGRPEAAVIERS